MSTLQGGGRIITDDLVLYLDGANKKSYSGYDSNWNDLTSEKNNGLFNNSPTFSTSNFGNIYFDGVDDFIDIPNDPSLNPTQSITLCAWIEYNGTYNGAYAPFIFKQNNYLQYYEQYVFAFLTTGELNVGIGNTGFSNESIISPLSYTNQLINAVAIIDVINGLLKIYVDGSLVQSSSLILTSFNISTNSVRIGGNNTPSFEGYFGGNIYNVMIYSKALTDSEILHNYKVHKSRFGK
jgi:hypothetical protein